MRIAIFSDIHGNKDALTSIIDDIKKENINEIICLGDTIGIGPNPKECMDMIVDNNITMVLGNHELYFLNGIEIDDEANIEQYKHHFWVRDQITDRQRKYLEKCSMTIEREYHGKKVLFEHFLIDANSKDQYPFYDFVIIEDGSIKDIVKTLDYNLIFIGHEHKDFSIDNKLYDVGSSGCRKDNYTRYTIFDTDSFMLETKEIEYDRDGFIKSLTQNDYPDRELIADHFYGIKL